MLSVEKAFEVVGASSSGRAPAGEKLMSYIEATPLLFRQERGSMAKVMLFGREALRFALKQVAYAQTGAVPLLIVAAQLLGLLLALWLVWKLLALICAAVYDSFTEEVGRCSLVSFVVVYTVLLLDKFQIQRKFSALNRFF